MLGVAASDLRDAHVPLDAVDGRLASAMDDRLEPARTPSEALSALTAALAGGRVDLPAPDPLVRAVVTALAGKGVRVSEVATAAAISERQLRRRFRTSVGYGPKTLQRVLRFQRVVRALADGTVGHGHLARCAAEAGYADQAHLTREFRELAGSTPDQVARALAA